MKKSTILIILLSALLFGLTQVVNKFGLNKGIDPFSFTFFMGFFVVFFTLVFGLFERDKLKQVKNLKRKDISDVALIGILVSGVGIAIRLFGLAESTATNSGIFQGISVLSTVIFSFFLLNERLSKKSFLLIFTIIFGAFLLSTNGELMVPKTGDLLLMASLIIPGFTNTYAKKVMGNLDSYVVSLGRVSFGFLALLMLSLYLPVNFSLGLFEAGIVVLAGFIVALRIRTFYESINRTNASYGATFLLLGALITPFIAYFTLGEILSIIQILGAILILGGAYLLLKIKKEKD